MLLPRPSLLTHLVVGASLAGGLALGVTADLTVLAAHAAARLMLALIYLPALAAIHVTGGAALALMSVLSEKAVWDMRREREGTEAASSEQ